MGGRPRLRLTRSESGNRRDPGIGIGGDEGPGTVVDLRRCSGKESKRTGQDCVEEEVFNVRAFKSNP